MNASTTHHRDELIRLDGSRGEGGGQILRSALSLSAITGRPFRLDNIRAGRRRPGLMRQHLTCVRATAEICNASTSEVELGSGSLEFYPGSIEASYEVFSIGTAGSTSLLLQTILPLLLHAPDVSDVSLEGGTHVIQAPCFDYLEQIFIPQLRRMGAAVELTMGRHGFFPAGGGIISLTVTPSKLVPCRWHKKVSSGKRLICAEVLSTPEIPDGVAARELRAARSILSSLSAESCSVRSIADSVCPGNALLLRAGGGEDDPGTLTCAFGEPGKPAHRVAKQAALEMRHYLGSTAPVDEYLADQLLLPLALAGGGGYTTTALTSHFYSNVEVIQAFLPVKIQSHEIDRFAWRVEVES